MAPANIKTSPLDVNDAGFRAAVEGSSLPVVLEFWSPACVHCRKMAKVVDSLALELAGKYLVAKVNILENALTPPLFGVTGLPAFFRIKDGEVVGRALGAMSKGRLKRELGIDRGEGQGAV